MSGIADALIGLFFEVTPNLGHSKHYFSYVEKLRPELVKHSGLVWLNRYQTLSDDCSLLSYQLFAIKAYFNLTYPNLLNIFLNDSYTPVMHLCQAYQ